MADLMRKLHLTKIKCFETETVMGDDKLRLQFKSTYSDDNDWEIGTGIGSMGTGDEKELNLTLYFYKQIKLRLVDVDTFDEWDVLGEVTIRGAREHSPSPGMARTTSCGITSPTDPLTLCTTKAPAVLTGRCWLLRGLRDDGLCDPVGVVQAVVVLGVGSVSLCGDDQRLVSRR
ncbi:hypothetical protein ACIPXV_12945 [Streptomyces libani]|uniref:hypothetical protein n=1 Tax=Streptomyces nigrescens TaxID=1920 RepID=UPI0038223938